MRDPRNLYSLEFFPPKTPEGVAKLRAARAQLAQLKPAFCSVTFGAGGSTREGTLATVLEIRAEGLPAAPHISCIGGTRESLRDVLTQYKQHGIRHVVALRGDLPSGSADAGEFRYASDLVAFIREETGDWFHVDVACYPEYHPQARTPQDDLDHFEAQGRRRRGLRDHAVLLQPGRVLALRRRLRGARPHGADRAGHHADRELQPARALLGRLRRRDPALDPPHARRATATTRRRCARSGSTWSPTCARGCSTAARPACTSTR